MKVIVTGGAGFIGSQIADRLVEEGHQVCVVDNLSSGKRDNVHKDAVFYKVDITDRKFEKVVAFERPEVIIHHAAQVNVSRSLQDPIFDAQVNILGTLNVLNSAKLYGVRKIVYATSPVGISKHTVIHYLEMFRELYKLDFTALCYSNVYGPRQDHTSEGGVVAIFSHKLLSGEVPFIFGDGEQSRDFVYVEDVVRANLLALTEASGETINICTETELTVNELYAKIRDITGSNVDAVYQPQRPGEIQTSSMSNVKARKLLNWKPKVSIDDGLRQTIDFIRS